MHDKHDDDALLLEHAHPRPLDDSRQRLSDDILFAMNAAEKGTKMDEQ